MYERRDQALLPRRHFVRRVVLHAGVAVAVIASALLIGIIGYRYLADLSWVDAFLNASMILGGMGPVSPLKTTAAKLFGGVYALFSGVVFIGIAGVIVAPFAHRV